MLPLQIANRFLRGFRRRAQKEYAILLFRRHAHQAGGQIRPRHALGQWVTEKTRSPNQGRSIAEHQVGIQKNAPQFHVVPGLHEEIDVRCDQVMRTA